MTTVLDMTTASELAVLRALERAGNRSIPRSERGRLKDVPSWEIYTHLPPVDPSTLDKVLMHAWELPGVVGLSEELIAALDSYTRILLASGHAFDRSDLKRVLAQL